MKGSLILALLVGVVVLVSAKAKMEHGEHVTEQHYSESGEHNDAYDHQSILGSKDEEDEFANLPPEEAKKRLEVIFVKMDTDHDEFVTKDEITEWIMKSYIQMDYEEAKSSFEDYDKDKDGKITWVEYVSKMSGDEPSQEDTDALKETLETDKVKFDVADQDKDGAMTLKEFAAFQYPYDFKHMHQVEIDATLQQMDTDRDGSISFKEFMGEVATEDEKDQAANKENFEEYDLDKDGKLDLKEMEAWIVPGNDDSAADEAGHLIEESDTNNDGKLSKDEITTKHELWVGSSATSYGKGLHDEL